MERLPLLGHGEVRVTGGVQRGSPPESPHAASARFSSGKEGSLFSHCWLIDVLASDTRGSQLTGTA